LTSHAAANERQAEILLSTPEGCEAMAFANRWRRDPANATLRRIYGDPYGGWTMGQVAALSYLICAGRAKLLDLVAVPVGAKPGRDSARAENAAKLANLPFGFAATIYEGLSHDGDGHLSFPSGPGLEIVDSELGTRRPADVAWPQAALEIGSTDASRTLQHLMESGVVARWPYGFDRIYVITTTPPYSLTPGMGVTPGITEIRGSVASGTQQRE
jgi:hypothetical protein